MVVLFVGDEVMNLIGKNPQQKITLVEQNPSVAIQLPSYHHQLAIRIHALPRDPGIQVTKEMLELMPGFVTKTKPLFHRAVEGSS